MIQVSSILADLKFSLGSIFGTDAHPSNKPLAYLNSALKKVVRAGDFPFFYSNIAIQASNATEYTSLSYDILECIDITIGGEPVDILRIDEFMMYKNRNISGQYMAILGDRAYSSFTGNVLAVVKKSPATVTEDGVIDLPESFRDMIFNAAMYYGSLAIKDFERARQFEGDFNSENTRLRSLYTQTNPSNSTGVGKSYSKRF